LLRVLIVLEVVSSDKGRRQLEMRGNKKQILSQLTDIKMKGTHPARESRALLLPCRLPR